VAVTSEARESVEPAATSPEAVETGEAAIGSDAWPSMEAVLSRGPRARGPRLSLGRADFVDGLAYTNPSFRAAVLARMQVGAGNQRVGLLVAATRVLQRQPPAGAGGAPSAPPTDTPPSAAGSDREAIDKALKSRDVGDVKAIKNFGAASQTEKFDLIGILLDQGWVGPRDEWALEAIWGSFDDFANVASQHLELWDQCRDRGAELEDLPQVESLRKKFKAETLKVAFDHLNANEQYVESELKRYGLSAEKDVVIPDIDVPVDETQVKQLEETKRLADSVLKLKRWEDELRKARVGKGGEPFDPGRAPLEDFKIGEVPSWQLVKQGWDQIEELLARILNSNPALFAALQHGESFLADIAGAEPRKNPQAMLRSIRTNLMAVRNDVKVARGNLESGRCDYRTLRPVHALLRGGAGGTPWGEPFYAWVMRNDVKGYEDREFAIDLGLQIASAALLIAAEFATLGGATYLILTGAGIGASALEAQRKEQDFESLAVAHAAQATPETGLVEKGQVDAAEAAATMAKIELAMTVLQAGLSAAMRAAPEPPASTRPGAQDDQPGPGPRTPGAGPRGGAPDEPWKLEDVEALAGKTTEGQHALKVKTQARVSIVIKAGSRTAAYDAGTHVVTLGDQLTVEDATIAYVHEMNHVEWELKGLSADEFALGKQEFVNKMCHEEAVGQGKAIRAKFELQAGDPTFRGGTQGEMLYSDAFAGEVNRVRLADPTTPDFILNLKGWQAGENALEAGILDGRITTGEGKSYPGHYQDVWMHAHGQIK
jgi:hypothetical protein